MTLITRPSMKHWLSAQSWTVKCCKLLTCHANRFFSWSFKTFFKSVVLNNCVYLCRVPFKVVVCSKQRDTVLFFQWLLQSWKKKKKNTKPLTTVLCVRWSGLCRDTVSYYFQTFSASSTQPSQQVTFLKPTNTCQVNNCTRHAISHSHWMLIYGLSHVEVVEVASWLPNELQQFKSVGTLEAV